MMAHFTFMDLFIKGGPIMWPLLVTSIVATTALIERIFFMLRERRHRDPAAVDAILRAVEKSDVESALAAGRKSKDFVARTLIYALEHRQHSFSGAILRAANLELKRFNRGLSVLDTTVTLAPLLGLLGTV